MLLYFSVSIVNCFRVYDFNSNSQENKELSFATLQNSPRDELPQQFVICTSHRQNRIDGHGFFHLLGEDNTPWLAMKLGEEGRTGNVHVWADIGKEGHRFGAIQPKVKVWYHMCTFFDTVNGRLKTAVNGEQIGKEYEED